MGVINPLNGIAFFKYVAFKKNIHTQISNRLFKDGGNI